jgi:hypothetical protein
LKQQAALPEALVDTRVGGIGRQAFTIQNILKRYGLFCRRRLENPVWMFMILLF